jgi:hypothetical protein
VSRPASLPLSAPAPLFRSPERRPLIFSPKYFGRPAAKDGTPFAWPGTQEGYPFKGKSPPLVRQEEYEETPIAVDLGTAILEIPTQMEEYCEIMDKIANGAWVLRSELVREHTDPGKWVVWLTWLEPYGMPVPENARRHYHGGNNGVSLKRPW